MTIFIQAENINPTQHKPCIDMIIVDSVSVYEKVIVASVKDQSVRFTKDTHTKITVHTPLGVSQFEFDGNGYVLDYD